MRKLLLLLAVVLAAVTLWAKADDTKLTADGELSLVGYTSVDLLADGDVTVALRDSGDTTVRIFYLVAGVPRHVTWSYSEGVDDMYADLSATTTYCIATPR